MSLQLILEHAPHAQVETAKTYSGGQFVIGRNDDCDWQLDDPERYVSRRHCMITDESGKVAIIDSSTEGVFVDGASQPLGAGNSMILEDQMRIRVGDFVIRVDMVATDAVEDIAPVESDSGGYDFGEPSVFEKTERPKGLPEAFGTKKQEQAREVRAQEDRKSRGTYDPFGLDLKKEIPAEEEPVSTLEETTKPGGGGYFDTPTKAPKIDPLVEKQVPRGEPEVEKTEPINRGPWPPIEVIKDIEGEEPKVVADKPVIQSKPPAEAKMPGTPVDDSDVLAALMRGLGVEHKMTNGMSLEEVEAVGARFRDMVDGMMFLLRTRAQEKQKVRVAQTLISNADVNPLKFLASADEAIVALIKGRDTSYLQGDKAVPGAFRDLADHQVRTWTALQTALRRMIDRFDPEEVERDMSDTGLLETLVAGGRSAKMWQLYQERYRDIAEAAEEKFLGEVGSDFRDAYETERT